MPHNRPGVTQRIVRVDNYRHHDLRLLRNSLRGAGLGRLSDAILLFRNLLQLFRVARVFRLFGRSLFFIPVLVNEKKDFLALVLNLAVLLPWCVKLGPSVPLKHLAEVVGLFNQNF